MKYLKDRHPGEFLKNELMIPLKITQYKIAKSLDVPQIYISEIVREKRNISQEMGLMLDKFFGFSEGYFSRLQHHYDLLRAKQKLKKKLAGIETYQQI